jgi:hypothetical protein
VSDTEKLDRLDLNGRLIPARHSPFWAIAMVFVTLVVVNAIQLVNLWNQHQIATQTDAALLKVLPQAKETNNKLRAIGEELIRLSATSVPAGEIVAEFNIRKN